MVDQTKDLDPAPLVQGLIDASLAGKLKWEATAQRDAFVVSVGGKTTFKMDTYYDTEWDDEAGSNVSLEYPRLTMLDEKGRPLWEVLDSAVKPAGLLSKLHRIARRIGNKLDERLAETLEALAKL